MIEVVKESSHDPWPKGTGQINDDLLEIIAIRAKESWKLRRGKARHWTESKPLALVYRLMTSAR